VLPLASPKTILFFFHDTESLGWTPMWTVQQYYSFVTRFVLGFGLAFELPVVVLALVKFGLVTYQFMARTRPYAIVSFSSLLPSSRLLPMC
jgi:sec-independent protein translocase protein TatC